ncbi:MAG TPA: glycosyltransferase family 4 protein [Phycisphaerae bacterium]|nr:glycosyltransferase family 4 protein [Phycisphaerae bacterium]HRR84493.1 glycosyltransferase family 4 protein [Phycisphaerae bacterium]
MHVIYIHQHFSTRKGATGTRSYEMSRRLLAAGHRVTMICGAYGHGDLGGDTAERLAEHDIDGIRVFRIAEPYSNQMSFMRRTMAFGRFARAAAQIACGLDGDLVFATSTPLTVGLPGMKAGRRLGVPFVFEVRDLWPELPIALGVVRNPLTKAYLRRMERRIYRAAHRIIALAPGIKEGICRTGYSADQVAMIPNCADLDLFRPTDEPLSDPRFGGPVDLKLVFTGAHGLANGLDAVLDAAAVLRDRGEKGIRLVFIGDGGQRERLMRRSQNEGLDALISWLPPMPKEELADVLPRMDAGMMVLKNVPAFYYGTSPNKFFDYIACGLPVLNNYPGWLADMVTANRCGLVVRPDDPEAFADAVIWMRDHRPELKEMGRRARELAEREFGRDRLADQFVRTLEEARASF